MILKITIVITTIMIVLTVIVILEPRPGLGVAFQPGTSGGRIIIIIRRRRRSRRRRIIRRRRKYIVTMRRRRRRQTTTMIIIIIVIIVIIMIIIMMMMMIILVVIIMIIIIIIIILSYRQLQAGPKACLCSPRPPCDRFGLIIRLQASLEVCLAVPDQPASCLYAYWIPIPRSLSPPPRPPCPGGARFAKRESGNSGVRPEPTRSFEAGAYLVQREVPLPGDAYRTKSRHLNRPQRSRAVSDRTIAGHAATPARGRQRTANLRTKILDFRGFA